MKIGILGGSFDPIHNGHIYMAKEAYKQANLDEIWLMPAGHSPNKNEHQMTRAIQRLQMCELAAKPYSYIRVSRYEVDALGTSYTYKTLLYLTEKYPMHEFFFIMGADSIDYFEKWCHPEIISSLCTILVINRDEFTLNDLQEKISFLQKQFPCVIQLLQCEKIDISSTEIRQNIGNEDFCLKYLNPEVYQYILSKKIYTDMDENNGIK